MRTILIIALLLSSSLCFSQKRDTVGHDSVYYAKPNELQMQRLEEIQKQITQLNALLDDHLQLILGVRKEDIESIDFKKGIFAYTLKPKKK